jgi:hypothetical protein|tara:strand:+ start:324 stop:752 length:429 start_codon:yes stop_codon:yes gene_type:complete
MNAVELEAYKLEQRVVANYQGAEQSISLLETYYNNVQNKEDVIDSVNYNINSLYNLINETYETAFDLDTPLPLTELDRFNEIIIDAKELTQTYYQVGLAANNDIINYLKEIQSERDNVNDYIASMKDDQTELNNLVNSYSNQ